MDARRMEMEYDGGVGHQKNMCTGLALSEDTQVAIYGRLRACIAARANIKEPYARLT
jgi:hypothetical protein